MIRVLCLLALLIAAPYNVSVAAPANGAEQFIDGLGQKAIALLADQSVTKPQREAQFADMLKTNFDLKTIGRFALGRHWQEATDQQKTDYQRLFENMVSTVYIQRFDAYAGQKFEVLNSVPAGSDTSVRSRINIQGTSPIAVEWRVRGKEGNYKIVDVVVENVSMSLTQRNDFDAVIQKAGGNVQALITNLQDRISNPTVAPVAVPAGK